MGQLVSGILSIFGGFMAAKSFIDAGAVNKKISKQNAEIGNIKANDAEARGEIEVFRHRLKTASLIGSQRAAFAASGINVNEVDSVAGNVIANTAKLAEMDATMIRTRAAREAWGYRESARQDEFKGEMAVWEAEQSAVNSVFQSSSSLYTKYGFRDAAAKDTTSSGSSGGWTDAGTTNNTG